MNDLDPASRPSHPYRNPEVAAGALAEARARVAGWIVPAAWIVLIGAAITVVPLGGVARFGAVGLPLAILLGVAMLVILVDAFRAGQGGPRAAR